MRNIYHFIQKLVRLPTKNRDDGLRMETTFWDRWFRTKGLDWPADYQHRLDPHAEITGVPRQYVDAADKQMLNILDVGAGPLTLLGKTHPTKTLNITATDVLAAEYDAILAKYRVTPPVRTITAAAEHLSQRFPADYFDIAYAHNSIDHAHDPLQAIKEMLAVTCVGGVVILAHYENEAESEGYSGLHQWNFTAEHGDFIIRNATATWNVSALLRDSAHTTCSLHNRWLTVVMRKIV